MIGCQIIIIFINTKILLFVNMGSNGEASFTCFLFTFNSQFQPIYDKHCQKLFLHEFDRLATPMFDIFV